MRTRRIAVVICLALAVLVGGVVAAEQLKSGPQVGEKVPGPFHPLNINGEKAGEKNCLFCQNGQNPVAMIFAREASEPLNTLIKKIDAATAKNSGCSMGSFVVFLSDSEALRGQLENLAKKENLKHTILSIDNPAGPKGYNVAQEADVTVVLYTDRTVKANYAFKKGQLNDQQIDKVLADLPTILPTK
jgi:hypothetical protein